MVDTPGFGDAIDNSDCWDPVLHYVESRVSIFKIFIIVLLKISEKIHTYCHRRSGGRGKG